MPTRRNYGMLGRPKKKERKDARIYARLNVYELKKLVRIMEEKDLSASEAVRFAINLTYDFIV